MRAERSRACGLACLGLLLAGCGLDKLDWTHPWGRDFWQRPAAVVAALDIRPGDSVVDLGAGDGYFLPWLSEAVGSLGEVIAVEVTDETIRSLTRAARDLPNVRVIRGKLDDPRLPTGEVDLVFLCNTYHHIDDREVYFERVREALAPGGRVAVVDPNAALEGPLTIALRAGHTSDPLRVREEMRVAGYSLDRSSDLLATQIFEIFRVLE